MADDSRRMDPERVQGLLLVEAREKAWNHALGWVGVSTLLHVVAIYFYITGTSISPNGSALIGLVFLFGMPVGTGAGINLMAPRQVRGSIEYLVWKPAVYARLGAVAGMLPFFIMVSLLVLAVPKVLLVFPAIMALAAL